MSAQLKRQSERRTRARHATSASSNGPHGWKDPLRCGERSVIADEENVLRILRQDASLLEVLAYDEFSDRFLLLHGASGTFTDRNFPSAWTDEHTTALQAYIQRLYIPRITRDKIDSAVRLHAKFSRVIHPIRDYLHALKWDGIPRVDGWLMNYLGAATQPPEYVALVARAFLVSAVARVSEPGCQCDHILVLEGPQGIRKSSALRALFGEDWFCDSLPDNLASKDAQIHLKGKWLFEFSELPQCRSTNVETLKAFLTRRADTFRPPYGRHEVTWKRQCVFASTTNEAEYLRDRTGNRRFWCVRCGTINFEALQRDRDQLWAETVMLYQKGTPWHLQGKVAELAEEEAKERVTSDPWHSDVARVVAKLPDEQADISPGEVLTRMDVRLEHRHANSAARVGAVLRDLGWSPGKRHGTRGQLYVRPAAVKHEADEATSPVGDWNAFN